MSRRPGRLSSPAPCGKVAAPRRQRHAETQTAIGASFGDTPQASVPARQAARLAPHAVGVLRTAAARVSERIRSLIGLHLAMVLGGATALFAKLIALPAPAITAWRSVVAVLALGTVLALGRQSVRLSRPGDYGIALVLGVLFALHWASYFHAIQVSSVAVAITALFTFPVITVLLEPLLDGARPARADLAAAILVFCGVLLMVTEFSLADANTRGVLWGVVSAVFYACRNVLQRRHFIHYPGKVAIFWQLLVVIAVMMPFAGGVADLDIEQQALLVLLGVAFTALPHTLLAFSLVHFRAVTVALINCLQVLYATAFAAWILAEVPRLQTALGALLVVGATAWETRRAQRAARG